MPKASPLQPSFTAGEFSPRLYGRTDSEQYKTGLATCLNYLPTIEGPIIRRPGTVYSGYDVRDPSKPPVLIPFIVSPTNSFILEFGDHYIRFFKNGGAVVTVNSAVVRSNADIEAYPPSNGSNGYTTYTLDNTAPVFTGSTAVGQPLEMLSPYNSSDLKALRYSMQGGELYVTCPSWPPYKLTRGSDYKWQFTPLCPLTDGPYLPFNSDLESGDRYNVSIVTTIVGTSLFNKTALVTAETNKFVVTSATRQWGPNSSYVFVAMSTAASHNFYLGQPVIGDSTGNGLGFTFGSNGILSGDIFELPNDRSLKVYDNYYFSIGGVGGNGAINASTFIHPALTKETCYNRLLSLSISGKRYWGLVPFVLASSAHQFIIKIRETPLPSASPTTSWQLGSFYESASADQNGKTISYWPRYNTFHQSRWVLSGNDRKPQEIYGSVVNEFLEFRASNSSYAVADNNSIQFILSSKNQNAIQWVASDSNALLAGGASSEFKISPSSQATALTPTNINASESSFFGSDPVSPTQTGNATLYVQRAGRKVRELNYFFQFNTYRSTDLTQLSEHITSPSVTEMQNVNELIPSVWALRSDGQLISMVYGRDDGSIKAGWARHELGGQSDSGGSAPEVLSMAVIAGSAALFDQLWLVTRRFINGTSVVSIEYLSKPYEHGKDLQEDAIFTDLSGTYDNPIKISGLTVAGSAIVTATGHGFTDGDHVQITKVVGLNTSVLDINGVEFNSNRVNYGIFRAASTTANTFFLTDVNNGSSYIDTRGYSLYVSGGEARKLVSNISGLTWLKNETVGVLADGRVHPDTQVNSAGVLALSFPAAKVHVGLKYNSDAKTLRLDAGAGDGSAVGKLRRPGRAAFQLFGVGEIKVGMSFTNMTPLSEVEQFKADNSNADTMTPLFSGIARESLDSAHDFDGQICIRQSEPLPGMVQSITQIIEENDV